MDSVLSAISSVGFPIVMCLIMLWYITQKDKQHEEESKSFSDALDKNTSIIQKLYDFLTIKGE